MQTFSSLFSTTIKVASNTDSAIIKGEGFQEAWDKYLRTLDLSCLELKAGQQPVLYVFNVVRTAEEQKRFDAIKKQMAREREDADTGALFAEILNLGLVGVENLEGVPDCSSPESRREVVKLLMAHGIGTELCLSLINYENRGISGSGTLKKS